MIYIAAWALMIGATEIIAAIKLRHEIKGEWFLILMGIVSIIFAIMLLWNPLPGALALVCLIGSYAIVFGVFGDYFWLSLEELAGSTRSLIDSKSFVSLCCSEGYPTFRIVEAACLAGAFLARPNAPVPVY